MGHGLSSQHGAQSSTLYDQSVFDGPVDGYSAKNGEVASSPSRVFNSTAVFAQGVDSASRIDLARWSSAERVKATSSDFTGSGLFLPASAIEFDTTVFNAGFVYHLLDPLDLFFNFSQGSTCGPDRSTMRWATCRLGPPFRSSGCSHSG